ncbi:MAG: hypothetical protein J6C46_05435 [Clostridia bacterium]|nr:hypothetical protein [Clostridia bacterium]
MTLKKWAWDVFETTGNLEAFLAVKEAEAQEKKKAFGIMEIGNIEIDTSNIKERSIKETQINGDINGVNKD